MSLCPLDDNLGVFVIVNGPTPEKITRSFWANNAGRRRQLLAFGLMPGFLFEEEGKKVVEPMLEAPLKLAGSIVGVQQESQGQQLPVNCVNLTVKIEEALKGVKPLPQFQENISFTNVLMPGAHLHFSYNVSTRMGGIALNGQRHLIGSQDYWETRMADGWLVAAEPPKEEPAPKAKKYDFEQSNTAW